MEGQITAQMSDLIIFLFLLLKEKNVHSHAGLHSLIALWIYFFFDKTGYWSPANCLCIEIRPHCIFDDEGLNHATAGKDSTADKRQKLRRGQCPSQQGNPPELQ